MITIAIVDYNGYEDRKEFFELSCDEPLPNMSTHDEITDEDIAEFLDMEVNEYIDFMIEKFNGFCHFETGALMFKQKKDAEMAAEFINSKLMMWKLSYGNKRKTQDPKAIWTKVIMSDDYEGSDEDDELNREMFRKVFGK